MYPYEIALDMDMYSICFLVGVLFALFFVNFAMQRKGFSIELQRLSLIVSFAAVVLGYFSAVLFQAFYNFMDSGVFEISAGTGATFFGGLIGGVVVFLIGWFIIGKKVCPDEKEPVHRFKDMLDMAAACVPIAHAFGRVGCFFAGCCHGAETDAWYGVKMLKGYIGKEAVWHTVVPVQLFEAIFLFALGITLTVLFLKRNREKRLPLMSFYAFFYGVWRYVIEFFRTDKRGATIVDFMTPSQLTSVLLVAFGILYFVLWLLKKKGVFDRLADEHAFRKAFGKKSEGRYCASGRINIIGEHIDYCGGKVLPAALGLKCRITAAKNGLDEIRLLFKGGEMISLPIADLPSCKTLKIGNYQAGVAYGLQQKGVRLVGCDLYYRCEVPFGGALSSSAAIEVSTAVALLALAGTELPQEEIALICQKAEHEFAGVACGIMDQFISACGKKDCAVLLSCDDLSHKFIPIKLGKYTFLLANCNRPHSLSSSKYNERRRETEEGLQAAKEVYDISHLAQLTPVQAEGLKERLPASVYARVLHVAAESERVEKAVAAMQSGDMLGLGALLDASHDSLKNLYEVSCEETDALQESLRAQKGCVGARMIGGGFGGCVLALVESVHADACEQNAKRAYQERIGYEPTFYPVVIEDGVEKTTY